MSISLRTHAYIVALAMSLATFASADEAPLTTQIVDAFNKIYGSHPGFRANHAKGIVVEGHFKASPEAAKLSRAVLVQRQHDSGHGALLRWRRPADGAGR